MDKFRRHLRLLGANHLATLNFRKNDSWREVYDYFRRDIEKNHIQKLREMYGKRDYYTLRQDSNAVKAIIEDKFNAEYNKPKTKSKTISTRKIDRRRARLTTGKLKKKPNEVRGINLYDYDFESGNVASLYDGIMTAINSLSSPNSINVNIYFKKRDTNKVLPLQITSEDYEDFGSFDNLINDTTNTTATGSDARPENEYELITDFITLVEFGFTGEGNASHMIWNVEEETNNTGRNCGINAMKKCGYTGDKDYKYFMPLENMLQVIKDEKLPIRIVNNFPEVSYKLGEEIKEHIKKETINCEYVERKCYGSENETYDIIRLCRDCKLKCECDKKFELCIDNEHKVISAKNPFGSKKLTERNTNYYLGRLCYYTQYIKHTTIYEPTNYEYTIIYCSHSKHFSVATDNDLTISYSTWTNGNHLLKDDYDKCSPKQKDNLFGFLDKYGMKKYERKVIENPLPIVESDEVVEPFKYLFFDFETIIDFDEGVNLMKPYSLSVLLLTPNELEELEEMDSNKNIEGCDTIRKNCAKTFIGYDCIADFFKWLGVVSKTTGYRFCGFNNSNFDNYFLFNELCKYNFETNEYDFGLEKDFLFAGSSLLNMTIKKNGYGFHEYSKNYDFFDLAKHLLGSLSDNCEGWKVNCCAKKGYDHDKSQQLFNANPQSLIDFCNDNEELKIYNEYDNLATAVITQRYKKTLMSIPCVYDTMVALNSGNGKKGKDAKHLKPPCITKKLTIGSLIYSVFQNECAKKDITFSRIPTDFYKELMRCKVAGRVEMFNGVQKIEERMASLDVCSLYPYVLSVLDCYYPSGEVVNQFEFAGFDTYGFYWVDFNQSVLREKNLPNIYPLKTETENDWSYDGEIKQALLSTTTIKLLHDFGVPYKIVNFQDRGVVGFTFTEYHKSCEMFEFLLSIMKLKNEQDTYKQKNNPNYNAPLRETLKLLMNAISGKVIEDYHIEETKQYDNGEDFAIMLSKIEPNELLADNDTPYKKINCLNMYGNKLFVKTEKHKKLLMESERTTQRPIYLGCALYDYAKNHMYRNSYSLVGLKDLVYTDTDATKTTYDNFVLWKNKAKDIIVPHWREVEEYDPRYATHKLYEPNSKVFGSFEDELEKCLSSDYEFYCVQKKSWCYRYGNKNKFRFKGVNGRSIHMDKKDFNNLSWITKHTHKSREGVKTTSYHTNSSQADLIYEYIKSSKHKSLGEGINATNFFRELYNKKEGYALCSSFRKHANNSALAIEDGLMDMNKTNNIYGCIEVVYTLKKIIIK